MEKRSRRRTRDLVTQPAIQGLSENEIGCARISMMARSKTAPFKGRIQKRKTKRLQSSHLACNTRPVHTDGSIATEMRCPRRVRFTPNCRHSVALVRSTLCANNRHQRPSNSTGTARNDLRTPVYTAVKWERGC